LNIGITYSFGWRERLEAQQQTAQVNADFRYRFESFDIEDTPDRHRNRLRARVGITATVTDNTQLGLELASGSKGPVSTNQTLRNDFSTKPVNIDQADLRWQPSVGDLDVYAGKFKNSLHRTGGLVWAYQEIEADAAYAIYTDSDFASGGNDARGRKLEASYTINSKVKLGGTLFLKARDMDFGNNEDYRRLMLDVVVKY
jgi:hypothetical protein